MSFYFKNTELDSIFPHRVNKLDYVSFENKHSLGDAEFDKLENTVPKNYHRERLTWVFGYKEMPSTGKALTNFPLN